MSKEEISKKGQYYQVIDGTFRIKVPENYPGAVVREYETKDGGKGIKHERIVNALFGRIEDISFYDGDYGKNLVIRLDEDEESHLPPIISLSVATNYGEDMLKKLPNINLKEEVRLRPFAFTPEDSEKERRGIEVTHRDDEGKFTKKVANFFYDSTNKKALNGYPVPEGEVSEFTNEDWKIFYLQARKFLVKYAETNILPKFGGSASKLSKAPTDSSNYPAEEINVDDIPF